MWPFKKKDKKKEVRTHGQTPVSRYEAASAFAELGGFSGAKFQNALTDVFDPELLDYGALRRHSAKLYSRNAIARSIIDTKTTTVINRGLTLEAKPLIELIAEVGTLSPKWRQIVEQRFDLWAKHKGCSHNFDSNFYQLELLLFREYLLKGQCISIVRFSPNTRRGRLGRINIQPISLDQLATPLGAQAHKKRIGEDIIDGFHVDTTGTIVGIYVYQSPEPKITDKSIYIPRWAMRTGRLNFVLCTNKQHIGDIHGVPDLSAVLHDIEKLEEYRVAEVQAAVVNSMIALIQNSDGENTNPSMLGGSAYNQTTTTDVDTDGNIVERVSVESPLPGVHMFATEVGQKLESFDTKRPNANFSEFVEAVTIQISSAVGVPQEILHKKFSNNYSASRAALLEYWRYVLQMRAAFATDFCQPIYEMWLGDEVESGAIEAPGWHHRDKNTRLLVRKAWANAEWQGIAKGAVDPVKEAKAAEIAEDRGWTTAEANAKEIHGKNFDTNIERRLEEVPLQKEIARGDDEIRFDRSAVD